MKLMPSHGRRLVTLVAHCVMAAALVGQARPTSRSLVVVATTDVHGRLRAWDYYDSRADSAHSLAAAATIVDSIRAAHPGNVVLVDAGDLLQGNPLLSVAARAPGSAPHPVIAAMNAMRYDAAAIGNHEFNYGVPLLRRAIGQATFPFLSANAIAARPREAFARFALVRRGDLTIGIVGATTPGVMVWDRDNVKGRLTYGDIIPAVRRAAADARKAGADVVIVVVHAGLDGAASYDTVSTGLPSENVVGRLPREVPGIDLVVYGHSHREMIDTMVNGVRLMQPRNYATTVGVATLNLARADSHWRVTSSTGASVKVQGHVESAAVLRVTDAAHRTALAFVSESIGVTHSAWRSDLARAVDMPITDLVGEVMRRVSGAQLAASPAFSLDARIDSGTITVAEIAKVYPFENTLRAVRISGAQLQAFLEHSANYWKTWSPGTGGSIVNNSVPGYNFDMVVGATYDLDLSKPVGQRVVGLSVNGRAVTAGDSYTIALSNYRQTGGGGFAMLAGAPLVYESKGDIREMIIDAVRKAGKLEPSAWATSNWRIIPADAAAAAKASFRNGGGDTRSSAPRLRVIGINDFHGAFESRTGPRGQPLGGAPALVSAIRRAQRECAPPSCYSVLVDGGDEFQGTPASNLAYGRTVVTLFDSLGLTAAALGNHEFDYGQDTLRARIRQASYAVLSANLRDTLGNIPSWIRQDTIVQRGPFTVGIIGISTIETPKTTRAINVTDLRFLDPAPIVSERAKALRARGANVIVVAGHVGGFCNAEAVCEGEIFDMVNRLTSPVDVVVSGHSHSLVNTRLRGVPIVQARSRGEAIDVVDLAVGDTSGNRPGDISGSRVLRADVLEIMADTIPPDAQAARIAKVAVDAVAAIIAQPAGRILADMRREGSQYALGNLVADAMREAAHSDIAVMNNGGIRANLLAGDVNFGRLYEVQPFGNTLYTLRVRGSDLRGYLARLVAGNAPRAHVSGVLLRYDPARPADDRLVDVRVDGKPIDGKRIYTITLNDFMVTGGDGLGLAGVALETTATNIVDLDALIAFVKARPQGVASPAVDRIVSIAP
ncbi:MAG: 5'-nucleotidase C-terminal domain-containing protein [Gemmatimonadaceae bacterium]|nr:5'-nucleotidase C-terminal domain-containing protein [Gemmatimonadaceae bacterium]